MSPRLLREIEAELGRRAPRRADPGSYDVEAAVSVLLRPAGAQLEFLAIKRSEHEDDPWSGHMALPGGRREPGDESLERTATRETREEIGVDLTSAGSLLGRLDDVVPSSRRIPAIAITPFVFGVAADLRARESDEVERVLWVPVEVLLWPDHRGSLAHDEVPDREFPTIEYEGHVIWGLTFRILSQLEDVLRRVGYE